MNERKMKVAKKKDVSQAITKVSPEFELPEFLQGEVQGLERLKEFVVPPYIKIVQKQASDELLTHFGTGDVILSPANAVICEMPRNTKGRPLEDAHTSFKIVPIFFYPEWLTWNPVELKGTEPAIRYRTVDPNDPVVAKARSSKLRQEPHPDKPELKIRHVEHLNFLVCLYEHSLGGDAAVLSFSRGEWSSGSKFANLIKMRKASLFGCVFEAVLGHRINDKGDWYGFDMCNPSDCSPWVTEEEYKVFEALHKEFEKLHADAKLQAAYDTEPADIDPASIKASTEF